MTDDQIQRYSDELHQILVAQGGNSRLFDFVYEESKNGNLSSLPISLKTAYRMRKLDWKDFNALHHVKCSTLDHILIFLGYHPLTPYIYRVIRVYFDKYLVENRKVAEFAQEIGLDKSHLHHFMEWLSGNCSSPKGISVYRGLTIAAYFEFERIAVLQDNYFIIDSKRTSLNLVL